MVCIRSEYEILLVYARPRGHRDLKKKKYQVDFRVGCTGLKFIGTTFGLLRQTSTWKMPVKPRVERLAARKWNKELMGMQNIYTEAIINHY